MKLTDSSLGMLHGDPFVNASPVRPSEMGHDTCTRHNVHSVLSVVQRLEHRDQCRPRVSFLVDAGAVIMQLNDLVSVC